MLVERVVDVVLEPATRAELIRAAQQAQPREACGALLGECEFGVWWRVWEAMPLPNRAADAEREFLITGDQVRAIEQSARARGLHVVGFYHSHPKSGAAPSATDLERAWPGYLYAIVGASAALGFWTLSEDRTAFRPLNAGR
jgi:proteasome lid subunit RPN8/RPN11